MSAAATIIAPEADREPNARLAAVLREVRAKGVLAQGALTLRAPSGRAVDLTLTASAIEALEAALSRLAQGEELLVSGNDTEISPEEASKILGISRPMVYHRMDTGRLPFRPVGTHRRVLRKDVMALREFEEQRRSFSREMSEDTDEQDVPHHGP